MFAHDTVQTPLLGNGLAIYGGDSNEVADNVVRDTLTAAAGVAISTRFNPVPFSGTTVAERNTLIRTGGWEPNWNTSFGAIWVFSDTSAITTPVIIRDTKILDSTYEGLLISGGLEVDGLRIEDTVIENTGSFGVATRAPGKRYFANTVLSGVQDNQAWYWPEDEGGNYGLFEALPEVCEVTSVVHGVWPGGFNAQVTLKNTGDEAVEGWELGWHLDSGESVAKHWSADVAQDGDRVSASNLSWNRVVEPGQSVTFGYTGRTNDADVTAPDAFTMDGIPCQAG
ncbi:cellulose binding domain-containing protein [Paraoerskovia sediminicola]|uniref:cellulose binding domain-containing protein n=1 Tax=Paraoerskovia sediminicola TaxID=1138587 RepID=UPI002573E54E|nr:cellulose binding domain-containing protein [Paraoerskovia sediminicola]